MSGCWAPDPRSSECDGGGVGACRAPLPLRRGAARAGRPCPAHGVRRRPRRAGREHRRPGNRTRLAGDVRDRGGEGYFPRPRRQRDRLRRRSGRVTGAARPGPERRLSRRRVRARWRPAVRLYLSSFRMGDHPEHFAALVGAGGRRAVVIANAMDDAPAQVRRSGVALAWLRGGNVFMLRFALFRSAGDVVLGDLLAADALVYAGYSAGACVLSSTLRGLEIVDDAGAVVRIYGSEPVWDGPALLTEAFLPHYQSPGPPETAAIDLVAARYRAAGVAYRPLRDGQALL